MRRKQYLSIVFCLIFLIGSSVSLTSVFGINNNLEVETIEKIVPRLRGFIPSYFNSTYMNSGGLLSPTYPILPQNIQNLESGFGSGIQFSIGESNETHIWVEDPTNRTDGYFVEIGSGYQELNASRGQTNQHFYNETSNEYTFNSAQLYNQTNVVDNTDWVTTTEYQYRFFFRLTNGSDYKFETATEITNFYNSISNYTIWCVGYESSAGAMAFYLNFQDTDWGHGQYLWYPRLKSGQLSAYNFPLYGMYPHLYAKYDDIWYDKILNDRELYDSPEKNPRNTLVFYENEDTMGLYFTTDNISIISSEFDFKHGFKFNFTDQKFHLISEFQCKNRDFQDIGWGYEITSSPQSDNTEFQPERFRLSNDTNEIELNISQSWDAGTYLEDYYSRVEIVSENNESFDFNFADMELAGFTEKYLQLHDQVMPDGSTRKTLLVGMYGYGSYLQGEWILIDPDTGSIYNTDNDDLHWADFAGWMTGNNQINIGYAPGVPEFFGYMAFDTDITIDISTYTISNTNFTVKVKEMWAESGEGVTLMIYSCAGLGDEAREDSQSYSSGLYNWIQDGVWIDPVDDTWEMGSVSKMNSLVNYWSDTKGSYDWLNFRFTEYFQDSGTTDNINFYESSSTGADPVISFTYTEPNFAPDADYYDGGDSIQYAGKEYAFRTDHTDPNGATDLDFVEGGLLISGTPHLVMYVENIDGVASTGTATIHPSYDHFIGDVTYERFDITDGYRMNWTYTIDWDWTAGDDSAGIDYSAVSVDDEEVGTGWETTDLNYDYENDLEVVSLTIGIDGDREYGGTDGQIDDDDWYQGGWEVIASGTVEYEGSSQTFDSSYATGVDVELLYGGGDTDEIDAVISSGVFTGITYTPTSGSNDIDTTSGAYFDVKINDIPSSGSDVTATDIQKTSKRDNESPTYDSFVMESGTFYADITNDNTPLITCSGATDGIGVGLHATVPYWYAWRVDEGGWNQQGSTSSTHTFTVTESDDLDFYVVVRDKLYNNEGFVYDNDNTVDLSNPTFTNIGGSESSSYLYAVGATTDNGYYSDNMGATPTNFLVIGDVTDNFGLEKAEGTTVFSDTPSDTSITGTSDGFSLTYTITSGESGTKVSTVTLYDQAGNSVQDTYTFYEDNTAPSGGTWDTDHDSSATQGYVPYGSFSTTYEAFYGQSSYTADASDWTDGAGSGIATYQIKCNGGSYGATDPDGSNVGCTLNVDSANDIYYAIYDNVGNLAEADSTIDVLYDTSNPASFDIDISGSALWTVAVPNYVWITDATDIASGTLFLNSDETDSWSISMDNSGTWSTVDDESQWKVVFEAGWGGAEKSEVETDWVLPHDHVFTSNAYATTPSEPNIIIDIVNSCGNYQRITITTNADTTDPTSSTFAWLHTDSDALVNAWDNDLSLYYEIGTDDSTDAGSGLQADIYRVQLNAGGWSALEALSGTTYHEYTASGAGAQTGYIRFYDKIGNYKEITGEAITVDNTLPILTTGIFSDDAVAPNWYDQGDDGTASYVITFTETNVYDIVVICTIDGSDRASDAGLDQASPYISSITITDRTDGEYAITLTIRDKAGNSDTTFSSTNNSPIKIDDTAPTMSSLEMTGGVYDSHVTNDNTPLVTASGASDGSGIGLHSTETYNFRWQVAEGSWTYSGLQTGATWTPTVSESNNVDFEIQVKDQLGNILAYGGTNAFDNDNTVDVSNPSIDSITPSDSSDYLYYSGSGTSIYYGSNMPSAQTFTFSGTASDNYNLEEIEGDLAFGENPIDTSADVFTLLYYIESTDDGTESIDIILYDEAGNTDTISYNFYEDNIEPTTTLVSLIENAPHTYIWYDSSTTVYFSDLMSTTDQLFTITVNAGDTGDAGLYGVEMTAWDDEVAINDTDGTYVRQYSTDESETTGSITLTAWDNVGNIDESPIVITMTEDTTNPTYSLALTVDSSADIGYLPNTGYYDDDSVDVDTSTVTEEGSGLPTNHFSFQRAAEGWSAYQSSDLYTFTGTSDGAYSLYVRVIDNVGNVGSSQSTSVTVDTDSPATFTLTWENVEGWTSSDYAYLDGTDLYFKNNAGAQSFNITANDDGTIGNSAFWKIEWDKNSIFETAVNDTSGLPDEKEFDYQGDGDSANLLIRVINNAGNYQTLTFTPDQDSTAPTTVFDNIVENSPNTYIFAESSTVYFSNLMSTTDQLFTVTVTTGDTGGSGVYGVHMGAWSDEQTSIYDSASPYSRQYSVDSDEETGSIDIKTYDQVGNYDLTPTSITMTEDLVAPSISVTWNFDPNDWCIKSDTNFGFTNIDITSVNDTVAGLNYGFFYVYNSSGIQSSVRYIVQGLDGDKTDKSYLDEYWYPTDTVETTGTYLDDEYDNNDLYVRMGFRDMVGNYVYENIYVKLDRTGPSGYTIVMESGYFYADITNDSTPLLTVSGATDSGSGLSSTAYYCNCRNDSGSWVSSSWESTSTYSGFTANESQDVDFIVRVRDVVGNIGSYIYDNDNTVDLSTPIIDSFTPAESSYYLYYLGSGTDGWYGSEMSSAQTFSFSGTASDNYNVELINSTTSFGDSPTDSTPATYSLSYTIESSDNGDQTVYLYLYDQAGNIDSQVFTFYEDNTDPTIGTLDIAHTTDTDSDGGEDMTPVNGYEDDLTSWSVSLSGASTDGSGSGLPTNLYAYSIESQSISDWQSGNSFTFTSGSWTMVEGSNDLKITVQDNVNNSAILDTKNIIADTDSPTSHATFSEISGNDYMYSDTKDYMYYSNNIASFNLIVTLDTDGGSGEYGVKHCVGFDLVTNATDTASPYTRTYTIAVDDVDTNIYAIVWNNAGNSHILSVTFDKDTTAPTGTITDIAESSDFLYDELGTTTLWYGNDMTSAQSFTITLATHNDADAGIWKMTGEAFFGESLKTDTSSDYSFVYSPDSSDTETGTLDIIAYDNVGNNQVVDTITVYRDIVVDAPTITGLSESSESLHTNGVTEFWYSEIMGGSDQAMSISIGATDSGGAGVYAVEFPAKWGKSTWNDTESTYAREYLFSSTDTDVGTITMTSHDNVGNTNTVQFTAYKDTTAGTTTLDYFDESSFYIYTSGSTIYYSDESFSYEEVTIWVTPADQGANPSGVYKVLFSAWDEQPAQNDSASAWGRTYSLDGDDTAGSITIKMYDNVGNLESSLIITVTRLTEAPTLAITDVSETSEWLYNKSLTEFYYGDDMSSAQSVTFDLSPSYAGVDGLSHVNTTIAWFGDSPTDSSSPYSLVFDVASSDTQTGTMTFIVWSNVGKNGTDTITVYRDITAPSAYNLNSPAYDGDGNVTVTGSTTDTGSGMRTVDVYEWWVNSTRDHSPTTAWTDTGSYEWLNLLDYVQTFYGAAYDYVGNWRNATTSQTQVDFTAPVIYWTYLHTDEDSAFHLDTTNNTQQSVVYVYYNPSIDTFSIFLNFTAWDLVGGAIENVTYSARFGDTPENDTGDMVFYNVTYSIEIGHFPEDSGESINGTKIVATAVDNVGLTSSVTVWFFRDLDAPTLDMTIDDDPDALLDLGSYAGWYNDTTVDTTVDSPLDGDHPPQSGLQTLRYAYKFNSSSGDNSYGSWESTIGKQQTVSGEGTWWIWIRVRDLVDNYREYNVTAYVDLTDAVINSVTFTDETYSPNWYKEEDTTASFDISWTETNPYLVNVSQSSLSYQQNDNDPSGSSSSFYATITGASHGDYILTIMAYDNAGNRVIYNTETTENINIDNTIPVITWLAGSTSESSLYLYFDGSNDLGYYSDKMLLVTVNFNVGGSASDTGSIQSGMATVEDNSAFGNNPSNTGSATAWTFIYAIDQNDNGDLTITYTATDNVGNTNTDTFDFQEDTANPTITWQSTKTNESFPYLYYDSSSQYGYYSDNMGVSTNNFIVGGIASDSESDLYTITDNTVFGNNPSNTGTVDIWAFVYAIDQDDDSFGTFTVTFTATDLVNNTATDTFEFRLDDTDPTISLTTGSITETSDFLYYDGSSTFGYYSDNMASVTKDFVIVGTTSDGGSALNTTFGTVDNTDFGNNPSNDGTTASWTYTYAIDDADSSYDTFYVTYEVIDHCNNTNTVQFQFIEDNTNPLTNFQSTYTSESSLHLYYDSSSQYGYYSDNMLDALSDFIVGGEASDSLSGLYTVEDNATFGNNPTNDGTLSDWDFTYSIDQNDDSEGSFNTTYTIKDKCNNSITTWFYFYLDNTNPTIQLDTAEITEESPYMYYDGSSGYGHYSDNMGASIEDFIVNGSSTDPLSGLLSIIDDTSFGNNPSNTGSVSEWEWIYQIDSTDTGTITVEYQITDNCNNNNTISFIFYEDTTPPTGSFDITQDPDALVSDWDNDTNVDTLFSSLSDPNSNPSGYNATYPVKYKLDSGVWGDWNNTLDKDTTVTEGTRTIYIAFHDYCNNTVEYDVTVYVDLTYPIISILDWKNPTYSYNWYRAIDNYAQFNVTWTDTNIHLVNASQSSLSYQEDDSTPTGDYSDFEVTITIKPDGHYSITVMSYDKAGNRDVHIFTDEDDKLKIDNTAPTVDFALFQHADALASNYYPSLIAYTNTSNWDDGSGVGMAPLFIEYRKEGYGWSSWTDTVDSPWVINDQTNVSIYCIVRDNLGWESVEYEDWVIGDTIAPVLGWLTMDETYAPNWYDQSVTSIANIHINWVEAYPFNVTLFSTLPNTNDTSPTGSSSDLTVTINGASDGSYALTVTIWDNAGNSDSTLLGSESPINLQSGMSGTDVAYWMYFNYYDPDGFLIEWNTFNTTYWLDEDYRNVSELIIYTNQLFVNRTSTIRVMTKNIFDDIIYNQTMEFPSSRTLYLVLNVYTLKMSNLFGEIINSTITQLGSSKEYTEQIMPGETAIIQMYIGLYSITAYIHNSDVFAVNEEGDNLDDFVIDLQNKDYALFVDAPLSFHAIDMIISEILQFNIITSKDTKIVQPQISIYFNDTLTTGAPYTPGTIVLSRPQVGYYNMTIYAEWQSFTVVYQRWITVESNAEITNFVVSGLESSSDEIYISWNTNKGTGTLTIYDNTSLIQTNPLEGNSMSLKSTSIGLHQLEFNISVETKIFSYYANYIIAEWTVTVEVTLYSSTSPTVSTDNTYSPTVTVTRSDGAGFSGYVYINGTDIRVTVVNNVGSFYITKSEAEAVGSYFWNVSSVQEIDTTSREFVSVGLTIIFDELIGHIYSNGGTRYTVTFNSSYTGDTVNNIRYKVVIGGSVVSSETEISFDIASTMSDDIKYPVNRTYEITCEDPEDLDTYVKVGTCNIVTYTKTTDPVAKADELAQNIDTGIKNFVQIATVVILMVLAGAVGYKFVKTYQKQTTKRRSSGVEIYDKNREFPKQK